jgi:hypothetical protein
LTQSHISPLLERETGGRMLRKEVGARVAVNVKHNLVGIIAIGSIRYTDHTCKKQIRVHLAAGFLGEEMY